MFVRNKSVTDSRYILDRLKFNPSIEIKMQRFNLKV